MISVSIPSFRKVRDEGYFVYEIHVAKPTGREVVLEKRYQEFNEFHKQIGKTVSNPPHFPSKKLPRPLNTNPRFLESRRAALEQYLKNLLPMIGISEVHDLLTGFLDTILPRRHIPNVDSSRASSAEDLDGVAVGGPRLTHQPLVCYTVDPFHDRNYGTNPLPNVVLQGTLEGLYGKVQDDLLDTKIRSEHNGRIIEGLLL